MRNLIAAVALLMLVGTAGFTAPLDNGDLGELGTPAATYTNVWGAPTFARGYVYDYSNYEWVGGTGETANFDVKCDVEMWLNMGINANNIYFHKANATTSMEATVSGWLQSNNGQYLFVAVPACEASHEESEADILSNLYFVKDGWARNNTPTSGVSAPIPVKWWLRDDQAGAGWTDFREGAFSNGGNNGQLHGMTWLLANGAAGMIKYEIKVAISPDAYQADGEYRMDPVLACAPEL
jgi:hypothetical protein